MKDSHPILVFIRGIPGSGKSYLAAALEESLGKEKVLTLDPDSIDLNSKEYSAFSEALSKEGIDKKFHPFRWSRSRACGAISANKIIVWNQPFTLPDVFNRLVEYLRDYASEHRTHLPVLVVEVELDRALAKQRIAARKQAGGHGPSERTLASRIDDYKSYADQGYKTIIVNGDDDISVSVAAVSKAIAEL